MMPIITQAQRDALIADCKADIAIMERNIDNWEGSLLTLIDMKSQLLRQQIALAALEVAAFGYINSRIWAEFNEAVCTGKEKSIEMGFDVYGKHFAVYTTPPVPVLKPVVLPKNEWKPCDCIDCYVAYDKEDVIKAIREAGYPIAGEDQ